MCVIMNIKIRFKFKEVNFVKKRIIAALLTLFLTLSSIGVFAYEPNWWAVDTVKGAIQYSLISNEYGNKPYTDAITRIDFINVAVNIYSTITAEDITSNAYSPFVDTDNVFPNMAYYAGIISGDGEGHFFPGNFITRQEMCKVITSMLSAAGVLGPYFPSTGVFDNIQDAWDIDDWAKDYVAFMLDNDLMAGYDGYFKPKEYVSREEAAIIAYRCYIKYGRDVEGTIQSALKSGTDSNGRQVYTLEKTVMQSNGTVIALRNAPDKQLVTPGGEIVGGSNEPVVEPEPNPAPNGTGGYAASGTPLQQLDADGLYVLKTYSETLATGEATDKEIRIFGDVGVRYSTMEEADAHMTEVIVPVWEFNENNELQTGWRKFRINSVLAEDVQAIFGEIYNSPEKPPIKDASGYAWRSALSGGSMSEHNYGTVIDLNYNENYCVYKSGQQIGSFYDPENSVFSFSPTGVVVQTFAKYGWLWGGNAWVSGTKDYMHFTYLGK